MASTTFTANGKTFKTTSNRRYALVTTIDMTSNPHFDGDFLIDITKRSDSLATITKAMHERAASKYTVITTVVDTTDGSIISSSQYCPPALPPLQ